MQGQPAGPHHRDRGTGRSPWAKILSELAIAPTIAPADPRAGPPRATQLPGYQGGGAAQSVSTQLGQSFAE